MPTEKIPVFAEVYRNVDDIELSDKSRIIIDGYLDEAGAINARPGLSNFVDLSTLWDDFSITATGLDPVLNVHYWPELQMTFAYCKGNIFTITRSGAGVVTLQAYNNPVSIENIRGTFTSGRTSAGVPYLFFANGASVYYTSDGITWTAITAANSPTMATQICWIDGYLLANTIDSSFVKFSGVDDPFTWGALDRFNANAAGDTIVALKTRNRELFVLGSQSVEIWENDGSTPFSRVPGGFIETGCIAADSVISSEDGLLWLSSKRKFVKWAGRALEDVSSPYDKEIQEYTQVSDCIGEKIKILGNDFYLFIFPAAGKALLFNLTTNSWSELGKYNAELPGYEAFLGISYCYAQDWNLHLFGQRNSSKVLEMASTNLQDLDETKRLYHLTGHLDHGTSKNKRCNEIRLRAKRGATDYSAIGTPKLQVRWKDDNKNWSNSKEISLGDLGDRAIVTRFYPRGIYATRQWEFTLSDAVPGIFLDAEEDFEVLR